MIEELKAASNFLTLQIRRNLFAQNAMYEEGITDAHFVSFRWTLLQQMMFAYAYAWKTDKPTENREKREIRLRGINGNDSENKVIEKALENSGMTYEQLRLYDLNLVLIINPGLVYVEGESTTVYYRQQARLNEDVEANEKEELVYTVQAGEENNSCPGLFQDFLMNLCICWSIPRPREL